MAYDLFESLGFDQRLEELFQLPPLALEGELSQLTTETPGSPATVHTHDGTSARTLPTSDDSNLSEGTGRWPDEESGLNGSVADFGQQLASAPLIDHAQEPPSVSQIVEESSQYHYSGNVPESSHHEEPTTQDSSYNDQNLALWLATGSPGGLTGPPSLTSSTSRESTPLSTPEAQSPLALDAVLKQADRKGKRKASAMEAEQQVTSDVFYQYSSEAPSLQYAQPVYPQGAYVSQDAATHEASFAPQYVFSNSPTQLTEQGLAILPPAGPPPTALIYWRFMSGFGWVPTFPPGMGNTVQVPTNIMPQLQQPRASGSGQEWIISELALSSHPPALTLQGPSTLPQPELASGSIIAGGKHSQPDHLNDASAFIQAYGGNSDEHGQEGAPISGHQTSCPFKFGSKILNILWNLSTELGRPVHELYPTPLNPRTGICEANTAAEAKRCGATILVERAAITAHLNDCAHIIHEHAKSVSCPWIIGEKNICNAKIGRANLSRHIMDVHMLGVKAACPFKCGHESSRPPHIVKRHFPTCKILKELREGVTGVRVVTKKRRCVSSSD